jgi:ABC-type uncharacterized transport system permease subunit
MLTIKDQQKCVHIIETTQIDVFFYFFIIFICRELFIFLSQIKLEIDMKETIETTTHKKKIT